MNPGLEAAVIGCSAGGLGALRPLVQGLDPGLRAAIVIVSHSGIERHDRLAELLAPHCRLPVIPALERAPVQPGTVHVAPSGYHLLIEGERYFSLSVDAKICFSRPSIDVLFESAAEAYRARLAGVVLTGANDDGAAGLKYIRALGGVAIVQDPDDAEVRTMPEAALAAAGADYCLAVPDIAACLNRICAS